MLFKRGKRLVGICPEEGTEGMNIRDPIRISRFETCLIHQHLMTSSILVLIKRLIQHFHNTRPVQDRIRIECQEVWRINLPGHLVHGRTMMAVSGILRQADGW